MVIILLAAGGYYLFMKQTGSEDAGLDNNSASSGALVGENAIYVPDQEPDDSVTAGLVVLAEPGFVVIHEADANGNPGAILGASTVLSVGESRNVEITLNRASVDGETLMAMLHRDNGDSAFDAGEDAPVVENDAVVMMSFSVSSDLNASVDVNL